MPGLLTRLLDPPIVMWGQTREKQTSKCPSWVLFCHLGSVWPFFCKMAAWEIITSLAQKRKLTNNLIQGEELELTVGSWKKPSRLPSCGGLAVTFIHLNLSSKVTGDKLCPNSPCLLSEHFEVWLPIYKFTNFIPQRSLWSGIIQKSEKPFAPIWPKIESLPNTFWVTLQAE